MLDKLYYNTILSQTFSPCGNYLLSGNIYGQIVVFDLNTVLNPDLENFSEKTDVKRNSFTVRKDIPISSMLTTEKFLVIGTINEISGWDWKSLLASKSLKPNWVIKIPSNTTGTLVQVDVNSMWWCEEEGHLFAGCGDNKIYSFDLDDGKLIKTYEGHADYIHNLHGREKNIISASEDGTVKLWDTRQKTFHTNMEPHKNSKLNRSDLGKWVGTAALGEDWLICGGGPRLALWHIRSLDAATVFDLPDHGIHVSDFTEDGIIAGGAAKNLFVLNYSGEIVVQLPVSSTTIYSAIIRRDPSTVLAIAGSSSQIDLCTTLNYRDQVLNFN